MSLERVDLPKISDRPISGSADPFITDVAIVK